MCFVPLLDPEFLDAASPSSSGAEGRYTSHALVLTGQGSVFWPHSGARESGKCTLSIHGASAC